MTRPALLLLPLLLAACVTTGVPQPVAPAPQPWLHSGKTFLLRHDGVLQLRGTTLPVTGLLSLDTERGVARLALLTSLGIKLATLQLTGDSYTVLGTCPMADRIPHFLEECAFSVQRMFLMPDAQDSGEWSVRYRGTYALDGFNLPETTIFTNCRAQYTVTLRLNGAEIR